MWTFLKKVVGGTVTLQEPIFFKDPNVKPRILLNE